MNLEEQARDWIRWSEEDLPQTGMIPNLGDVWFVGPWRQQIEAVAREYGRAEEDSHECVVNHFLPKLIANPLDFAVRYTALDLYYGMLCTGVLLDDLHDPLHRAEDDLQRLIETLAIDKCPPDWERTHWEICTACIVKDWQRALGLYDRAEKLQLLDITELQKLRGLLLFLVAFGPALGLDLDAKVGLSCVVRRGDTIPLNPGELFHEGLRVQDLPSYPAETDIQRLWAATNDFQDVVRTHPDTELETRSMLGMCLFAAGRFRDAAYHYQLLIGKNPCLRFFAVVPDQTDLHVLQTIAICHQSAGDEKQAQIILEGALAKYPSAPGLYRQLAELQAQQGEFRAAYESLRMEVDVNPKAEADMGIRVGLALGAIPRNSEAIGDAVDAQLLSNPELTKPLESLVRAHWATFANLTDEARGHWRNALFMMYLLPVADIHLKKALGESAATKFALVVEVELREKVFSGFREYVRGDSVLSEAVSLVDETQKQLKPLADCILRNKPLELGSMEYILRATLSSTKPLFQEFGKWISKEYPHLINHVDDLKRIVDVRNPLVHGRDCPADPGAMLGQCLLVLDSFVAPHHGKNS